MGFIQNPSSGGRGSSLLPEQEACKFPRLSRLEFRGNLFRILLYASAEPRRRCVGRAAGLLAHLVGGSKARWMVYGALFRIHFLHCSSSKSHRRFFGLKCKTGLVLEKRVAFKQLKECLKVVDFREITQEREREKQTPRQTYMFMNVCMYNICCICMLVCMLNMCLCVCRGL